MTTIPHDAPPDPALELACSRVLDGSRAQVWATFEDPGRLARWWGPAGFTNRFEHFDFRPGGEWRFTMHGPDGKVYRNLNRFLVIEPAERLVLEHVPAPHFVAMLSLHEEAGGTHTRLHWRMRFESAALRDAVAGYAAPANEQNLDRLQAELARTR